MIGSKTQPRTVQKHFTPTDIACIGSLSGRDRGQQGILEKFPKLLTKQSDADLYSRSISIANMALQAVRAFWKVAAYASEINEETGDSYGEMCDTDTRATPDCEIATKETTASWGINAGEANKKGDPSHIQPQDQPRDHDCDST